MLLIPNATNDGMKSSLGLFYLHIWEISKVVNGWQLAKMKKSIPDMSLAIKFIGMKQLV